jgi:Icc-related predicted phosphoesterase
LLADNMLRILAFSDLHGDPKLIERVKSEAKSKSIDVALCCGDITPIHGNTIEVARAIGNLGVRTLAVPGNFELPDDMRIACKENNWTDLHGKYIEVKGYLFAGCGGGNKSPFNTPYELSEDEFKDILSKLDTIRSGFIMLTHCPPYGVVDEAKNGIHLGSKAIAEFIALKKPLLHFCGHIHEQGGNEGMLNGTKVINVARNIRIIEI